MRADPLPINGRPLAAGVRALDVPDDPLAAVWHLGDFLREYRGDSHNAAWVAAGLTATDIGMLTELSWGMPTRSYSRTRGWTDAEFDRSEHHLRDLGYLDGEGSQTHLSQQGRHAREQIEVATDQQMRRAFARSATTSRSCSTSWRRGATRSAPARAISAPVHTTSAERSNRSAVAGGDRLRFRGEAGHWCRSRMESEVGFPGRTMGSQRWTSRPPAVTREL